MSDHLTEQELAQYVDAIRGEWQELLPEKSLGHVEDCASCKVELIEILDLMDTLDERRFQDET